MKIYRMPQYSPEWWEVRRGIPTASAFDRILTPTGKLSEQCEGYIDELIADRLNQTPNFFTERGRAGTPEMQFGRDTEPEARRWYEFERGCEVEQIGFAMSDDGRYGCSPDGIVHCEIDGQHIQGGLELKCPKLTTHVGYLRKGILPMAYRPQVHGQLLVTGWPWVDFVSYAAGAPPFIIRVVPDDYTEMLRLALEAFHDRYTNAMEKVIGSSEVAFEHAAE